MKKFVLIFLILLLSLPFNLFADKIIEPRTKTELNIPLYVYLSSQGPRNKFHTARLRLTLVSSEHYLHLYIEEIALGLEEGEENKVVNSLYLTSFEVAEQFGYVWLEGLEFLGWQEWNELEFKDFKTHFLIKYTANKELELKTLE